MHDKNDQPAATEGDVDARLSAAAMGQLEDAENERLAVELQASSELRSELEDLSRIADALSHEHASEPLPAPSLTLRDVIATRCDQELRLANNDQGPARQQHRWSRRRKFIALAVTACLLVLLAVPYGPAWWARRTAKQLTENNLNDRLPNDARMKRLGVVEGKTVAVEGKAAVGGEEAKQVLSELRVSAAPTDDELMSQVAIDSFAKHDKIPQVAVLPATPQVVEEQLRAALNLTQEMSRQSQQQPAGGTHYAESAGGYSGGVPSYSLRKGFSGGARGGYPATPGSVSYVEGVPPAQITIAPPPPRSTSYSGLGTAGQNATAGESRSSIVLVNGRKGGVARQQQVEYADLSKFPGQTPGRTAGESKLGRELQERQSGSWYYRTPEAIVSREQYEAIIENSFVPVVQQALSTLSIDVDTASYANVRRFLTQHQLPPANAVRIEELINYFSYDYPAPDDEHPFASLLEVGECPWQPKHRLVRVGLLGKTIARETRPGCNLVFLLDVSGSMKDSNKLPLLKQAMKLLVDQLDENDRVAIVTYASQAGVALKSTVADKHDVIREAINGLNANGSTNGGAGIQLAYEQALLGAIEGGVNRVILATDGDLNVGITDDDALVRLITEKAASDVFLTVLGFGEGNLKDAKLEKLADHGNGVYAYIDNLREARKVLVEQVEGSLVTIAKDVKIKVEFNPAEVQAYRLIGYENRLMTAAEFDDDRKDAGEIGAGHSVTALYEIVPAAPTPLAALESLKYQQPATPAVPAEQLTDAAKSGELLTLSLRYKLPEADESTLLEVPLLNVHKRFSEASMDFRFATAVASFGMLLRDSQHRGDTSFAAVEEIAAAAIGADKQGYRTEFLDLVRRAAALK